jgi:hypothetical protein
LGAESECTFNGLRHVDLLRPLFCANRIAVKRVYDRIATAPVACITGRQKDKGGAVDGVPFEIAFERLTVNRDALDSARSRPGTTSGTVVLTWPEPTLDPSTTMNAIVVVAPCAVIDFSNGDVLNRLL